jgi:ABC-type sugar transport system ATPase subunit
MTFSDVEITRLRRAAGSATVLPTVSSFSAQVRTQDGEVIPTAQVRSLDSPGRFYTAAEGTIPTTWRRGVIVGARLANNNNIAVGDRIDVRIPGQLDRSFRVVAILQPQGFADPLSADRAVFVPLAQFDDPAYDQALVRVDPQVTSIDETATRIKSTVNARDRATELLERVGLGDRLDHYPDELSGGQKQRVAIARALINEPRLVLADEPTGNLDRDTGDRILDLFDELRTAEDVAVVTVTHDEYVAYAADRTVDLIDGQIQTDGPPTTGTDTPSPAGGHSEGN